MVLKATEQRGQVPWQETLVPEGTANWKVRMQSLTSFVEHALCVCADIACSH